MSPEAPVIPDPPASNEQAPVAPIVPEVIPPAPTTPEAAAPEAPAPALITVPENIQADLDARKAERESAQAAAAATRVIGPAPGVVPAPVATNAAPVDNGLGGRSGLGVIEVPMPPDPSKVPGWNGEVRH
jgi:hypothetical protein